MAASSTTTTPESFIRDDQALALGQRIVKQHLALLITEFEQRRSRGMVHKEPEPWGIKDAPPPRRYFAMTPDALYFEEDVNYQRCTTPICSEAVSAFRRYASQFYDIEDWGDITGDELRFFEKKKQ